MTGFNVSEAGHVVNVIPPIDGNAGAPVPAQAFSMKGWHHVSIIIQFGVLAAAPTSIIVKSAATAGGSGTAMPFRYYSQTNQGVSNDVLSTPGVLAPTTGITSVTAHSQTFYVIEMDSMEFPDGSPFCQLVLTCPGSSCLVSAVAILSAGRDQYGASSSALV